MKKTSIFATVTALAALVIYLLTSLTGFMAGKAMNIWPVVLRSPPLCCSSRQTR